MTYNSTQTASTSVQQSYIYKRYYKQFDSMGNIITSTQQQHHQQQQQQQQAFNTVIDTALQNNRTKKQKLQQTLQHTSNHIIHNTSNQQPLQTTYNTTQPTSLIDRPFNTSYINGNSSSSISSNDNTTTYLSHYHPTTYNSVNDDTLTLPVHDLDRIQQLTAENTKLSLNNQQLHKLHKKDIEIINLQNNKITELNNTCSNKQDECSKLLEQMNKLPSFDQYATMQQQLIKSQHDYDTLQQNIYSDKKATNHKLQEEINIKNQLQKQYDETQQQLQSSENYCNTLQQSFKAIHDELNQKDELINSYKNELNEKDKLINQFNQLDTLYEQEVETNKKLQIKLDNVNITLQQQSSDIDHNNKLVQGLQHENETLQNKLTDEQNKVKLITNETDTAINKYKNENQALQQENNTIKQIIRTLFDAFNFTSISDACQLLQQLYSLLNGDGSHNNICNSTIKHDNKNSNVPAIVTTNN